eukprot:349777-Chlamydomonas_euryale.AAC.6
MVASAFLALWKSSMSLSGYSQITSELRTKKGWPEPSSSSSRASASGPAVPIGSASCSAKGAGAKAWLRLRFRGYVGEMDGVFAAI